jgi:DamX protein
LPFTDAELQGIVSASHGLPGKVDEIAGGILDGAMSVHEAPTWLPPWHRAVAALLVVAIGMAWLVWDKKAPSPSAGPPAAVAYEVAAVPPIAIPERPLPAEQPRETAEENARPTPSTSVPVERTTHVASAVPEPPVQAVEEPVQSAPPPSEPAKQTPKPAEPIPPKAEPEAPPTGLAWIEAQAEDRFTLQLLGTSSKARVDDYLAKQPSGSPIAAYRSERNGSAWYVVIYGSYASADVATAASKRLPASIGKVTPWVRRFGAVRADIRS